MPKKLLLNKLSLKKLQYQCHETVRAKMESIRTEMKTDTTIFPGNRRPSPAYPKWTNAIKKPHGRITTPKRCLCKKPYYGALKNMRIYYYQIDTFDLNGLAFMIRKFDNHDFICWMNIEEFEEFLIETD